MQTINVESNYALLIAPLIDPWHIITPVVSIAFDGNAFPEARAFNWYFAYEQYWPAEAFLSFVLETTMTVHRDLVGSNAFEYVYC